MLSHSKTIRQVWKECVPWGWGWLHYPRFLFNPNLNELCDFKFLPPNVLFTASLSQIDHLCPSHNQLKLPNHQDLPRQQNTSAPSMNGFQTKSEAAETFCNVLTPTLSLSLAPPARLIRVLWVLLSDNSQIRSEEKSKTVTLSHLEKQKRLPANARLIFVIFWRPKILRNMEMNWHIYGLFGFWDCIFRIFHGPFIYFKWWI